MEKTIATIRKNAREVLKVELTNFKGHDLLALRLWVEKPDTSDLVPTAKGINVAISLLPAIREALAEAERDARATGLLTDEKART